MTKEQEIKELAKTLYQPQLESQNGGYGALCTGCFKWDEGLLCKEKSNCTFYTGIAEHLYSAGYGNIKQAKEDMAKMIFKEMYDILHEEFNCRITVDEHDVIAIAKRYGVKL